MLALSADGNVGTDWRRGRVAEGTSLLRMHTAYTCIVGSNPTVSARKKQKAPARELFPLTPPGDEGAICMAPAWDSKGCPYLGSPLRIVHLLCATRTAQRAVGALPIHTFAVKHAPQRPSSRKARRPQPCAPARAKRGVRSHLPRPSPCRNVRPDPRYQQRLYATDHADLLTPRNLNSPWQPRLAICLI
jgi:hypothetical protein